MGIVSSCLNASSRQLLNAASDGDADTVREVTNSMASYGSVARTVKSAMCSRKYGMAMRVVLYAFLSLPDGLTLSDLDCCICCFRFARQDTCIYNCTLQRACRWEHREQFKESTLCLMVSSGLLCRQIASVQVLEAKPQLANHTALTTGYNCLHYAAGNPLPVMSCIFKTRLVFLAKGTAWFVTAHIDHSGPCLKVLENSAGLLLQLRDTQPCCKQLLRQSGSEQRSRWQNFLVTHSSRT